MLFSALVVGLVSSLHCLGMCGPIALALPVVPGGRGAQVTSRLLYNAGRVLTYSTLGLMVGAFGQSISFAFSQQYLSVAVGAVVVLFYLIPTRYTQKLHNASPLTRFSSRLRQRFGPLFKQRSFPALFLLGLLNGLLPCGMVYIALAGATATGNAGHGAAYMALFGLGTLPVMLAVSMGSTWLRTHWRTKLAYAPLLTLAVAALLILRGLNLGIPMVSPKVQTDKSTTQLNCCHKPARMQ